MTTPPTGRLTSTELRKLAELRALSALYRDARMNRHDHAEADRLEQEIEEKRKAYAETRMATLALLGIVPKRVHETSQAHYRVQTVLGWMQAGRVENFVLDLNPPYQRGHRWSARDQQQFAEAWVSRTLLQPALEIHLGGHDWLWPRQAHADIPEGIVQLIDGKQRLTTLAKLVSGEIRPWGLSWEELAYTPFSFTNTMKRAGTELRVVFHECQTHSDAAKVYLELNATGAAHTDAELELARNCLNR